MLEIISSASLIIIGIAIGFGLRVSWVIRLHNKTNELIDKQNSIVVSTPIIKSISEASEYIILTHKQEDENWYISRKCTDSELKAYCPSIHNWFAQTNDAVNEVQKLINLSR